MYTNLYPMLFTKEFYLEFLLQGLGKFPDHIGKDGSAARPPLRRQILHEHGTQTRKLLS